MNPATHRRIFLNAVGLAILAAALWFVGTELVENWSDIGTWRPTPSVLVILVGLSILYSTMLFLLAESWHRIIGGFGEMSRDRTYTSYALSQIMRYLPGNFAHLFGRALILRGKTLSDGSLAKATIIELGVTPVGAFVALILLAPFVVSRLYSIPLGGGLILLVVTAGILVISVKLWLQKSWPTSRWLRRLLFPVLLSTMFMLLLGAMFAAICNLVGVAPPIVAMAAAIVAWIAGYIAPGIPGGLGIREAALVLLLSDVSTSETLLLASVLLRLVTTAGEVFCFVVGVFIARHLKLAANLK